MNKHVIYFLVLLTICTVACKKDNENELPKAIDIEKMTKERHWTGCNKGSGHNANPYHSGSNTYYEYYVQIKDTVFAMKIQNLKIVNGLIFDPVRSTSEVYYFAGDSSSESYVEYFVKKDYVSFKSKTGNSYGEEIQELSSL